MLRRPTASLEPASTTIRFRRYWASISDLAAPDRAVGQLAILHLLESIAHSQGQEVATDPGRVISVQPLLFKAQFLDAQRAKAIASARSHPGLDLT
jgi:hypothetical protein